MKKVVIKNRKKGRGLTKTFAFGGFEFDTPQEAIMNNQRAVAIAKEKTANDSGLKTLRNIGTGFNIAGNLVSKYGSSVMGAMGHGESMPGGGEGSWSNNLSNTKFGQFVGNNTDEIAGVGNTINMGIATFSNGGMILPEYGEGGTVSSYDTKLTKAEEKKYNKWKKNLPKNLQYEEDYDLRGFWKENPKWSPESEDSHMTDKYKKPNHPTFSNESQYHTEELPGGSWNGETFMPSQWQQQYAMGGQIPGIPVEVEGDEMGELPNGQLLNFQGPTHENGGIPIDLPSGTKIYSDRVSIDGKTMAQRKAARERKINTLQKKADKGDRVAKGTLDRYMLSAGQEEKLDMGIQQMLNEQDNQQFAKGGKVRPKFLTGSGIGGVYQDADFTNPTLDAIRKAQGIGNSPDYLNLGGTQKSLADDIQVPGTFGFNKKPSALSLNMDTSIPTKDRPFIWQYYPEVESSESPVTELEADTGPLFERIQSDVLPTNTDGTTNIPQKEKTKNSVNFDLAGILPTIGDAMGIYGNWQAGKANQRAVNQAKASQRANINAFEQYGKEGLKTLDESKQFAKQMGDIQRSEIELARKSATTQNRQSARSINTMRALDLASQAGANRLDMQAYQQEAAQLQAILGQEAAMKNNIDQVVMTGEQARDLRDRDDAANLNNMQLRADLAKANALSHTGKSINDIAERNAKMNAMNDAYGNFKYTASGKLRATPGQKQAVADLKAIRENPTSHGLTDYQAKNMTDQQLNMFLLGVPIETILGGSK